MSGPTVPSQPATVYFPPPPTAATNETSSRKPIAFNFSKPRSSTETTSSVISLTQKQQPRSILKKHTTSTRRTRQWVLLLLLILSFTVLILSVIFAYCAALPHSDNVRPGSIETEPQLASASAPTATSTVTLLSSTIATAQAVPTDAAAHTSNTRSVLLFRDGLSSENATADTGAQQAEQSTFSTPSALASLAFYTALLPLMTMLHTSIELLSSLARAETSQHTKFGNLVRSVGRSTSQNPQSAVISAARKRRTGATISLTASALLFIGWLVMQIVWTNCEIRSLSSHDSGNVCPIQIRGHRMAGIDELSVGKVVLGWAVVLIYVGYAAFLYTRVIRPAAAVAGAGRRQRLKARFMSKRNENENGDDEEVIAIVDLEKLERK